MVDAAGTLAGQGGAALTLAVLDSDKKVVSRQRVQVESDGSFAASIPVFNLPAGNYRMVFVTDTTPQKAVAGGSFAVGRPASEGTKSSNSGTIQPYTPEPVRPHTAETVRPYTAETIKP